MTKTVIIEGKIAQINLNAIAGVVAGAEVLAATQGEGEAIVQKITQKAETEEARIDREEILIIEEISPRIDIKEI